MNGTSLEYQNIEAIAWFFFTRQRRCSRPGVSAMVRAKNEESKIGLCLESIYDAFDEIIFVDNASTDQTVLLVKEFVTRRDEKSKIRIFDYPFKVSRCGDEHFKTPENSVHSLAYYYNWALSKCSCAYICKWDADMVLADDIRGEFSEFLKQVSARRGRSAALPIQTLYRDGNGQFFKAREEINQEVRVFPNVSSVNFTKARLFEVLSSPQPIEQLVFPKVCGYELKFTDQDEFSHWSTRSFETRRKIREWANYTAIRERRIDEEIFESLGGEAEVFPSLIREK